VQIGVWGFGKPMDGKKVEKKDAAGDNGLVGEGLL
jgi:hypothetical protein